MEISIRHAEPEDYEALRRVHSGPRAVAGTLQSPFPSREVWRRRLADPKDGVYSLVAGVDGEVVGNLDLETFPGSPRLKHTGRIGMAVRDEWQGNGVGTALLEAALDLADNWLALTRIELTVYTDNTAGIALYEKFGFEIEGTHRRYAFRNGLYADAYSMARIRG